MYLSKTVQELGAKKTRDHNCATTMAVGNKVSTILARDCCSSIAECTLPPRTTFVDCRPASSNIISPCIEITI